MVTVKVIKNGRVDYFHCDGKHGAKLLIEVFTRAGWHCDELGEWLP